VRGARVRAALLVLAGLVSCLFLAFWVFRKCIWG
jgi:hypothetical protein